MKEDILDLMLLTVFVAPVVAGILTLFLKKWRKKMWHYLLIGLAVLLVAMFFGATISVSADDAGETDTGNPVESLIMKVEDLSRRLGRVEDALFGKTDKESCVIALHGSINSDTLARYHRQFDQVPFSEEDVRIEAVVLSSRPGGVSILYSVDDGAEERRAAYAYWTRCHYETSSDWGFVESGLIVTGK